MNGVVALLLSIVWAVVIGVAVSVATDGQWIRDCKAIGAHLSNGKIYDCKERP